MGACRPLSLSLGLPGASIHVCVLLLFFVSFVHRRMGFKAFGPFLCPRTPFVVAKSMGFNTWTTKLGGKCMGFKRYHLKNRANASNKHVNALKTRVNSSRDSMFAGPLLMLACPLLVLAGPC